MENHLPEACRGYGRGRPIENADLRRPFAYMYSPAVTQYVPAEGSDNVLRLGGMEAARHDVAHNGEPGMYFLATGDHGHPGAVHSSPNSSNNKAIPEKKHQLSPYAPEFVPRNFRPEPRGNPNQVQVSSPVDSISDSYSIQELRQFLFEITLNPGKFEPKIQRLVDCLNDYVDDDDTMRAIVNIVFDESVRQPNFRYNGARLCKHLCNDLVVNRNFLQLLLHRCSQEHKRREFLARADDGGAYLRGFAMYLAELFSQLEVSNQKIKMLGENLTAVVETLLSNPTPDNLKCICQILKLVGVYLEDQERSKIPNSRTAPDMDKIISSLSSVAENQDFPKDIRAMVSNVVDFRSSDWGRASENDPVIEEYPPPTPLIPRISENLQGSMGKKDEPVMYGPDGKPISDEESLFLHSQYSSNASDAEEYDGYDETAYEEMGDEIQAAYEVFLNEMAR